MTYMWSQERIDFFKDASYYTGFHKNVAQIIKPYLDEDSTLCDLGCGLGLLDFHIAKYVKEITAIDFSELALADYKLRLSQSKIENIKIVDKNIEDDFSGSWDIVLLSFYGRPGPELDKLFSYAKKEVIMVTYVEPLSEKNGKMFKNGSRPTTSQFEQYLIDGGYRYESIISSIDFGQPFRDLDAAKAFFGVYSREEDPVKREKLIALNMLDVKKNDDDEFPYFLPKIQDVGIFIISK